MIPMLLFFNKRVHFYEKMGLSIIIISSLMLFVDQWTCREDNVIKLTGKSYFKRKSSLLTEVILVVANVPAAIYFALSRTLMR